MRRLSIFALLTMSVSMLLSACGGDSSSITGESGTTTTGGTGTTGGTTTTLSMGSTPSGSTFQSGAIAISTKSLSAGGSTSLQVSIEDQTGALYTTSTPVTFNSPCVAAGTASITPSATVTTSTGTVTATYIAAGCSGSDTITATASANSQSLTATGTVTVAPAAVGSISFISATPSNITLKGTGATVTGSSGTATSTATSTVIFKVLDTSGGPAANAAVTFALSTSVGGITLSPTSGKTDANGQVQTVVSGGTVATTVRVTATTTGSGGTAISTESSSLTVSTGIPTSNNISLAVKCYNVEALDYDGVTVPVTVSMTDRFSNPVPDGTTANFQTTLGGIQATCQTAGGTGTCSVNWTSKAPYTINGNPATTAGNAHAIGTGNFCGATGTSTASHYCNGTTNGRSPIIVTAIGEESFVDTNGSGVFNSTADTVAFDPTDADNNFPNGTPKAWFDTSEPFLNQWELYDAYNTPTYVLGEPFIDFNSNGMRDGPDGLFEGALCTGQYCNTSSSTVAIYASNVIIASGSQANFSMVSPTTSMTTPFSVASGVRMYAYDQNFQPLPNGSTIAVTFSTNAGTLVSGPTAIPCTAAAPTFNATTGAVTSAGSLLEFNTTTTTTPAPGTMYVTVTTPRGIVTTQAFAVTD